jgi:hypothetical protein
LFPERTAQQKSNFAANQGAFLTPIWTANFGAYWTAQSWAHGTAFCSAYGGAIFCSKYIAYFPTVISTDYAANGQPIGSTKWFSNMSTQFVPICAAIAATFFNPIQSTQRRAICAADVNAK